MAREQTPKQETFEADFIVIGAGSAGCAAAARLSEDPATRVLLLEAGGEDTNRWIHIPLGFGKTFADASVNWCYETEPDPGAGDRKVFWPRGKVLGRLVLDQRHGLYPRAGRGFRPLAPARQYRLVVR